MDYVVMGQTRNEKTHAIYIAQSTKRVVKPARCGIKPTKVGCWQPCLHGLDVLTCNRCRPLVGLEKLE